MLGNLFNALLYEPLYNALTLLVDILPSADVGLAVVLLTVLVRVALLPLSIKATRTQLKMKVIEPKLREIQEEHKDDRETQAKEMMKLYREARVNPFSSIFVMFIQILIIVPLFLIFRNGIAEIDPTRLYAFIPEPETINTMFLGLIDVAGKSLPIALVAGLAQFFQSHVLLASQEEAAKAGKEENGEDGEKEEGAVKKDPTFGEQLQKSLKMQMRFVFPIILTIVAYTTSAVVGIYFTVSALFSIAQELFVKRKIKENHDKPA